MTSSWFRLVGFRVDARANARVFGLFCQSERAFWEGSQEGSNRTFAPALGITE